MWATAGLDEDTRFKSVAYFEHGGAVGVDPAHRLARDVADRVEVLPVEVAVQALRLAARGGHIEGEDRELDPPWDEALDVQHVQALVEPVHEEGLWC